MIERKVYDPYTMAHCHDRLCAHRAEIACPVCGWTYCLQHWNERMHARHARLHAAREMLSARKRRNKEIS